MQHKNCLILNFVVICLITIVLIRDRSINEMFEIAIERQNESSIVIPGYQANCQEADELHCEIYFSKLPLVIHSSSNSHCQATYGKQVAQCYRVQASALDTLYIQDLQLSQEQQAVIAWGAKMKPIASLRILEDGAQNAAFLQAMLFVLSIVSGLNVAGALHSYFTRFYPNSLLREIAVMLSWIGVPLLLCWYFLKLLISFGYAGW